MNILRDGRFPKFVGQTQQVTFNGPLAAKAGQEVWYFTERAVFRLIPDGIFLVEVAPGVDVDRNIRDQVGFPLRVAPDLRAMDPCLFREEPMGLAAEWQQTEAC